MPYPDSLQIWPTPFGPNAFIFPAIFTAGNSLSLTIHSDDYRPVDGWVLTYNLRGIGGDGSKVDLTAGSSGGDFILSFSPTDSANWMATHYSVAGFVTNAGTSQRIQVYSGECQIQVNLPVTAASIDTRSHARRVLDAIEAVIEGRASNDILDSTIDNTSFRRLTPDQLTNLHSYYTAKVRSEIAKARVQAGLGSGRNILTRFTIPA